MIVADRLRSEARGKDPTANHERFPRADAILLREAQHARSRTTVRRKPHDLKSETRRDSAKKNNKKKNEYFGKANNEKTCYG